MSKSPLYRAAPQSFQLKLTVASFSCPVNNAGIGLVGPVESIPIEEMKKVFETNFFGVIRMIKEVMPDMKKRRGGHIIVVSSVMGLQGWNTETF